LLLLSLIVLIGNLAASGYHALRTDFPAIPAVAGGSVRTGAATNPLSRGAVDSGGRAPVLLRQRFLLGYRLDINRAGRRELADLPGISEATADAMLAERRRIGRFRSPEELLRVRGIKDKRLKKILPFLSGFHNN